MLLKAKGNLIAMAEQGMFDIIVHGCNCMNVFGAGIAKEIKNRYPGAYETDTKATIRWKNPVAKLGNFSYYATNGIGHPFIIINAYTQVGFSSYGEDVFEYESFSLILRKFGEFQNVRFGFPYIGMGLCNGKSDVIIPMLEKFAEDGINKNNTVTLVEFR